MSKRAPGDTCIGTKWMGMNCEFFVQRYVSTGDRHTGHFFASGGGEGAVNHLPKKTLASCPNVYETVETK